MKKLKETANNLIMTVCLLLSWYFIDTSEPVTWGFLLIFATNFMVFSWLSPFDKTNSKNDQGEAAKKVDNAVDKN